MPGQIRILRLQRTDKSDEHILLRVEQASVSRPLDLKLIATEHEHLYHAALKSNNILSIKVDRYTGSEDELRDILCSVFLQEKPDGAETATLQGLEMVAAIEKSDVVLTIRRRIGGITPRIASLRLGEDDERQEVQPFEWLDSAVRISDQLRQNVDKLDSALAKQRDENAKLKQQLDEFIKLKKDNEAELLQKFAALLNTKKQKIREQQGLLDDAGVSAKKQHALNGTSSHKRKAQTDEQEDVEMDDAEEEFDGADQDEMPTTPPATDDERSETDAVGEEPAAEPTKLPSRHVPAISKKSHATQDVIAAAEAREDDETDDEL